MRDKPKHNQAAFFRGNMAVQKVLASAGMRAHKVGLYRDRLGSVWEVETDKGMRWVSYTETHHWKISKSPPEDTCSQSE